VFIQITLFALFFHFFEGNILRHFTPLEEQSLLTLEFQWFKFFLVKKFFMALKLQL